MDSEKFSEKEMVDISKGPASEKTENTGISRRKFTLGALAGTAVLLTLSNRPAWSGGEACVNTSLWTSYSENTNAYASYSQEQKDQIDEFTRYLGQMKENNGVKEGFYTGKDPNTTCYKYN